MRGVESWHSVSSHRRRQLTNRTVRSERVLDLLLARSDNSTAPYSGTSGHSLFIGGCLYSRVAAKSYSRKLNSGIRYSRKPIPTSGRPRRAFQRFASSSRYQTPCWGSSDELGLRPFATLGDEQEEEEVCACSTGSVWKCCTAWNRQAGAVGRERRPLVRVAPEVLDGLDTVFL